MSCGTPVVGFNVGGIADIVDHQQNGYLAPEKDAGALLKGIHWVLEDEERLFELGVNARAKAEREYAMEAQARRYAALFEAVLHQV